MHKVQTGRRSGAKIVNTELFVPMYIRTQMCHFAKKYTVPQTFRDFCYVLLLRDKWTSKKNQWNAYNAIWSRAFGLSITRNLITRGLTICHAKLTQTKELKQTRFVALHNLWLLLVNSTVSARKSKLQVKLPLIKTTKRNIKIVFFLQVLLFWGPI